jgi:hypothetical protein
MTVWSTFGRRWAALPYAIFDRNPLVQSGAIQFPATQVPSADANALDDYEEGTFTPAFQATGATFSYSQQAGAYVKIGRQVTIWVDFSLAGSGNTLTANNLTITGLPFTASASNGNGIFPVRWNASTTSYTSIHVRIPPSTSGCIVEGVTAAATGNVTALVSNAALHATNGTSFRFVATYFV